MKESRYFIKKLTPAEVGDTGTHEYYIRLTNDFDIESFFQKKGILNSKNAIQIDFDVTDITFDTKPQPTEKMKCVYYVNSNGEKRIPSLKEFYDKRNIKSGDIICLESVTKNGNTSFFISINRYVGILPSKDTLYYSIRTQSEYPLDIYKRLNNAQRKEVFEFYIEHLDSSKIGIDQIQKYSRIYVSHIDNYVKQVSGLNTLYDVCSLEDWDRIESVANSDPNPDPNYTGAYRSCFNKYKRLLEELMTGGCRIDFYKYLKNSSNNQNYSKYLTALRTKPFLLLAGISGTGKSRIVREIAYKSCLDIDDLRDDKTTPGNYLMVEVKPNWHDSSELLGYYSNISKKYILTPFVKFLVKAKKYPKVPFFVCLDEMNLAPVEQYFAEFLSVLETRRKTDNGIKSGTLVKKEFLAELGETEDLCLPENVFIVGTVNMDDTTHQFSRKVIDRAMTIEMNGGNLEDMFGHSSDLDYVDNPWTMDNELRVSYVNADEVLVAHQSLEEKIKEVLPKKLNAINKCLKNTPFEVSYRVLNELTIYLGVLLDDEPIDDDAKFEELVEKAVDQILLMKILPRIEGDAEMFNLSKEEIAEINNNEISNKLSWLKNICPNVTAGDDSMTSKKKLEEMISRMNSGFTRYWP